MVQGEVENDTLIFSSAPFLSWLAVAAHFEDSQPHLTLADGVAGGPFVRVCTPPANGQGEWIAGSRETVAQTNLHTRIPKAFPNHHVLCSLLTWDENGMLEWAPNSY